MRAGGGVLAGQGVGWAKWRSAVAAAIAMVLAFAGLAVGAAPATAATGVVSGTVQLPAGMDPAAFDAVEIELSGNSYDDYAQPNASGVFAFGGVPAGDYDVSVRVYDYYDVGLEDWVSPNLVGQDFSVSVPASGLTLPVITLEEGGSISGTVTLPYGADPAWFDAVTVYASGDGWGVGWVDPATGEYTISGLARGEYTVSFEISDYYDAEADAWVRPNLVAEFYDDATSWDAATPVDISIADAIDIDADLISGRTITGTALPAASSGVRGLEAISVSAQQVDGDSYGYVSADPVTGDYALVGLLPGEYLVTFQGEGYPDQDSEEWVESGLVSEYFDNVTEWDAATTVDVTEADAADIDAELVAGSTISGTVHLPEGVDPAWIDGVNVRVESSDGVDTFWGPVEATGDYRVSRLPAGAYTVCFDVDSYWDGNAEIYPNLVDACYDGVASAGEATTITVPGDATGIDATLALGRTIAGNVTLEDGASLDSIGENAYVYASPLAEGNGSSAPVDPVTGDYAVVGLAPGEYEVHFAGQGYWDDPTETWIESSLIGEYYDNAEWWDATPVDVTSADAVGIDAELAVGHTISGVVSLPDGADPTWLEGASVDVSSDNGQWGVSVNPSTGAYAVAGLPDGEYTVRFSAGEYWSGEDLVRPNLVPEYYDNVLTPDAATPVIVAGADVAGIDAEFAYGRTISGTVTLGDGADPSLLGNVSVYASGEDYASGGYADVDPETGAYAVAGLAPGVYTVEFDGGGYWDPETDQYVRSGLRGEYFDDVVQRDAATPIDVSGGDATDIDAELAYLGDPGGLSVELTAPAGGVPTGELACLVATGIDVIDGGVACADTIGDGPFEISGLLPGSYELGVFIGSTGFLVTQYFGGTNLAGSGSPVAVETGATTELTFALQATGAIAGEVTYADESLLDFPEESREVLVYAEDGSGGWEPVRCTECGGGYDPLATGVTDESGAFTIAGLVPGDYKVAFRAGYGNTAYLDPEDPGVPTAYYGGTDLASAAVVTVTAGGTASPIDAVLQRTDGETSGPGGLSVELAAPAGGVPTNQQACVVATGIDVSGYGTACADTIGDGPFVISGLLPGSYELGVFVGSTGFLVTQYFGGSNLAGSGSPVAVETGATTDLTFALQATGAIAGEVTYADESLLDFPEESREVLVYAEDGSGGWEQVTCTECGGGYDPFATGVTDAAGAFTIAGLVPGDYKVAFRAGYGNTAYLDPEDPGVPTAYYGGTDLASAAVVTVTAGGTASSIDAVLQRTDGGTSTPAVELIDISKNVFKTEINWLASTGITRGWSTPAGAEFRPSLDVNREVMAAFLYRFAGEPAFTAPAVSPFVDVKTSHPFYKEISWLASTGITRGWDTPRGLEYRPSVAVSREVMAAFLYRFAGEPAFTPPAVSPFRDVRTSQTFYKEISWLASTGITRGWDTPLGAEFRPGLPVKREVMAAFLYRFADQFGLGRPT